MKTEITSRLSGKVSLITGGASGIGRGTALAFAREGATVVVADRDETGALETVALIKALECSASYISVDVSEPESVKSMMDELIDRYGHLDCAFNNAGIAGPMGQVIHDYPLYAWDQVFNINIRGVMLCMQHEIRQMLLQGSGTIVNTASIWGMVGAFGSSAYVASKHAVVGLTKAAGIEYAAQGIRVNAVSPGTIRTPMLNPAIDAFDDFETNITAAHPIGRIGEPGEVAEAVIWLSTDASSFVVGQNIPVDGGFTLQ